MKTETNIKENEMQDVETLLIPVECCGDGNKDFGLKPIFTGNCEPFEIKVEYKKESKKAVCFQIKGNKDFVWFPKKALRKTSKKANNPNEVWLQFWFKLNSNQLNSLIFN